MFVKCLIPVIIAFLLVSCVQKKKDNSEFSIKNNIIYKNDSNTPYTGIIKSKSEGKLFEYSIKNGLKDGEFKVTFENGKLIMKGNIVADKNEGRWVYYYPSGELETEGNFKGNKADSVWTWYYPSGKVKEKGFFVNGLREGKGEMFDESGNVSMENDYKKGVVSVLGQK